MALPKYGDVSRTKTRYIYVLLFNFRIFIYFVINKNDRKNGWVLIGYFFTHSVVDRVSEHSFKLVKASVYIVWWLLKRHNQAKNHPKAKISFSLLDMSIICEHAHKLDCESLLNYGLLWQRSKCVPKTPFFSYSRILDMHVRN